MSARGKYTGRLTGAIGQWSRGVSQIGSRAAQAARFAGAMTGRTMLRQIAPIPSRLGASAAIAGQTAQAGRGRTSMDAAERAAGTLRAAGNAASAAQSKVAARRQWQAAPVNDKSSENSSRSARRFNDNLLAVGSRGLSMPRVSFGSAGSRTSSVGSVDSRYGIGAAREAVRKFASPDGGSRSRGADISSFARAAESIGSLGRPIGTGSVAGASYAFHVSNLNSAAADLGPAQASRQSGPIFEASSTDGSQQFAPGSASTPFNRAVVTGSSIRTASLSAIASPAGGRLAIAASPIEFAPLRLTDPVAGGRGSGTAAGIIVNSSPTIIIQNGEPGQIGDAVIDALRNHRAELYEEIYQEARRRLRSDF